MKNISCIIAFKPVILCRSFEYITAGIFFKTLTHAHRCMTTHLPFIALFHHTIFINKPTDCLATIL